MIIWTHTVLSVLYACVFVFLYLHLFSADKKQAPKSHAPVTVVTVFDHFVHIRTLVLSKIRRLPEMGKPKTKVYLHVAKYRGVWKTKFG